MSERVVFERESDEVNEKELLHKQQQPLFFFNKEPKFCYPFRTTIRFISDTFPVIDKKKNGCV